MKRLKVLLVDDHVVVREALHALLQHVPGVRVVGEAADGPTALKLLTKCQPDIVLMDMSMEEWTGIQTTLKLRAERPELRIVILSAHIYESYVVEALKAGAVGYLPKSCTLDELTTALQTVARGETYLPPALAKQLDLTDLSRLEGHRTSYEKLTPRLRQVLELIAEGQGTKQIAQRLRVTPKTVEYHRTQLMARLRILDVPGLVRYAAETQRASRAIHSVKPAVT